MCLDDPGLTQPTLWWASPLLFCSCTTNWAQHHETRASTSGQAYLWLMGKAGGEDLQMGYVIQEGGIIILGENPGELLEFLYEIPGLDEPQDLLGPRLEPPEDSVTATGHWTHPCKESEACGGVGVRSGMSVLGGSANRQVIIVIIKITPDICKMLLNLPSISTWFV